MLIDSPLARRYVHQLAQAARNGLPPPPIEPTPPAEAVTCSNAALQAFQRFADYDAKTDCYVVQADDLRPAIDAALAARGK